MKKIITLSLSLLFITSFYAQKLDYDHDSKWFFGLNAGGTWQTTDVKDKLYVGYGFVLGRSFNYNYGKKFSFDLRFRYLGGKWYGQDYDTTNVSGNSGYDPTGNVVQKYDTTLGYTINNFQAQVHELGLELVLHANSLRERTGWDPYIFGGVNVVWNQTFGDLYNQDSSVFNNSYYNYSPNGMSKSEWKGLSDDIYDSALDGSSQSNYNVNFMPSLGIGLAYQVGPRFSVGIEHKTTFALKDNFDGYQNATKRWGMFTNDVYHYTSLMLKFNFRSRKVDDEIEAVNNDCLKPAIGIVTPVEKTLMVSSLDFDLEALISQVAGKNNITLSLNGVRDTNFVYSTETSKLKKSFTLIKGQNTIDIVASNGCGTTTEKITVNYEECVPPVVSFINPSTSQITTSDENYTITAKLEREKTIVYSINGRELRNYNVNEKDSTFSSTITLAEGKNEIKITVSNECGTDEKIVDVTYVRCDKPVIKIKNGDRAIKVDKNTYTVDALFENVTSKSQISLKLNNVVKSFTYNTSSKELIQKVTLNEGLNTIEIKATNNCGDVTETITVEYAPCITPLIAMLSPTTPTLTTDQTGYSVQAKIENISDANQVAVVVNGRTVRTGTYNSTTKIFKKIIPLNDGINTVSLTVTTDCGTVSSNFTITKTVEDEDMIICFKGQTLVIKESQWASYQGQGAVLGECPKVVDKDMTICFKGQTLVIKESQWASYLRQGATQGECPKVVDKDMTICFKGQTLVIKESQWASYQGQGAVQGECPKVVDKDMTICFKGQTLVIKESQWASYQRQGAIQGECPKVVDKDMTICFKGQTLVIKESQWASYQGQGAVQGECPKVVDKDMTICFKGQTLVIKESQWASYQRQGATQGECPKVVDKDISICFKGRKMVIKESQLPSYLKQGATEGECPQVVDNDMVICFKGRKLTIKESQWPSYQSQGAVQGECPQPESDLNITICLKGETKVIKESEWASYQSKGAVRGECVEQEGEVEQEETMIICHGATASSSGTTMEILVSEWPAHQAHGDKIGECVEASSVGNDEVVICLNGETKTIKKIQLARYKLQGATEGPCN